jgi:uroporphyrinogen decarboxylase
MTSKERVITALEGGVPDRVPFDLGGTMMTGIHVDGYNRLRPLLGLEASTSVELFEPSIRHVVVEDDFYRAFPVEIDTRPALPLWAERFPLVVKEDDERFSYTDEWGYGLAMPKSEPLYFSLVSHPLAGAESLEEIDNFPLPDPDDESRYRAMEGQIAAAEAEGRAVVCNNFAAGTMEVASWLMGMDSFLMDLALEEVKALRLMERIADAKIGYWKQIFRRFGSRIDVVIESDDLGSQESMLIAPDMYRRFLKPLHKKIFSAIRALGGAKIFFHSCGAIAPIIPDLIGIGVDALNPLQYTASGMETKRLKGEYGRDLAFWGGGVDTQSVLCRGSAAEVEAETLKQLELLSAGGGFVFATVHNIQADVPPENIVAMTKAVGRFNGTG